MEHSSLAVDTIRAARTYLSALLPSAEVDDAMHEVLADVSYWGDRDLEAVLRVAHAVVAQRARVSDEAAVQALAGEVGLDDDDRVGAILSLDPFTVGRLRAGVTQKLGTGEGEGQPPVGEPDAAPVPTVAPPSSTDEQPTDGPVRIGFDEDEGSVIETPSPPRGRSTGRSLALAVAVLWVVVAIVLLLVQE